MPGEPELLTDAPPRRTLRLLVVGALATAVLGFGIGFALGGRSDDGVTALGPQPPATSATSTSTTSATSSTTSTAPASSTTTETRPRSTTTGPTTTEAPPDTEAPTTVAPTPTTTAPAPPTTPAPTFQPPRVVVSYATDSRGRLVLPRGGSATLLVVNEGGQPQQWLVTGTGFTTSGPSQGTLPPGQTVTVTILAPRTELPGHEITGTISVLGAVNPSVPFVIPAA